MAQDPNPDPTPIPPLAPRPRRWWIDVLVLAFVLALTFALTRVTVAIHLDIAVRDFADAHRPQWAYAVARVVNFLGQGTPLAVITLIAAILLARRWRSIRPLLVFFATYFAVGAVIGPLKLWTDRVAPHYYEFGPNEFGPPYPDAQGALLFTNPAEESFPSGHAVNTIIWYALLVAFLTPLFPALARYKTLIRVAPPVLVAWSMSYLAFHWFSEALAGIALGILIERIVFRIPWEKLPLPAFLRRFETSAQQPGATLAR
ncbi:phosphatase PAP2 family protein [Phytomonospora sp. NPDC050363]|uniref:phosphatase PAP2 family protein n=1 Tax=Phytomonospora sp. NPDC050363 TaxID=3155642 RepID=UPI00341083A4